MILIILIILRRLIILIITIIIVLLMIIIPPEALLELLLAEHGADHPDDAAPLIISLYIISLFSFMYLSMLPNKAK